MGPAGTAGPPLPPRPIPPLPPPLPSGGAGGASCPRSEGLMAMAVPTTSANPNATFFIPVYSMQISWLLLAERQILALILHQTDCGSRLLSHGHGDFPIFSECHWIAYGRFVEQ